MDSSVKQALIENIVKALSLSLSPNNQIRNEAEAYIKQVRIQGLMIYFARLREHLATFLLY